jgi:hypothetical protein
VGGAWEVWRGVRFYSDVRVARVRLRSEKAEDAEHAGGIPEGGERTEEAQRAKAKGVGAEFVGGFEGPLPWGWFQGFNWTVSFHLGRFDVRPLALLPVEPSLNSAPAWPPVSLSKTWGMYLGALWYP